jgi:uncharacterized DUF497 family protein
MRFSGRKRRTCETSGSTKEFRLNWAALVFEDERRLVYPDRFDSKTEELRWHPIGSTQIEPEGPPCCWLFIVYREEYHGEEIIRIISARAAEKHEIRRYRKDALD